MKIKELINTKFSGVKCVLSKNSPEIFLGLGIAGVVAGGVAAAVATYKLKDRVEVVKNDISTLHETEEPTKLEVVKTYTKAAAKVASPYIPAIGLEVAGVVSICASYGIMKKRNVSLAIALTAVQTSFNEYRKRVIEKFGTDVDQELRLNQTTEKVEVEVVDENGKVKKQKQTIKLSNIEGYSDWAVCFNDSEEFKGVEWVDDYFIDSIEKYSNTILATRVDHIVTWRETLEALGLWKSAQITDAMRCASMVAGWKLDDSGLGDNKIKLNPIKTWRRNPNSGELEKCIILDPNIEGDIYVRAFKEANKEE